jgi:hypothetical protein
LALARLFKSSVQSVPGKGDRLVVNRQGKGSLPATMASGGQQLGLLKSE